MAIASPKIDQYLSLTQLLPHFSGQSFELVYDAEGDVLYIHLCWPVVAATKTIVTDDDVVMRYAENELIGLTILNASQRVIAPTPTQNMM